MNILVIGNGFDLAHGLPTKYTDFLEFVKIINSINELNIINDSNRLNEVICENQKMNPEIKLMITKKFEKTVLDKDTKELLYLIEKNFWIDYFLQNPIYLKENWIDFENEISRIIQSLDKDMHCNKRYELDDIVENLSNKFLYKRYSNNSNVLSDSRKSIKKIVGSNTFRIIRDDLLIDLNRLIRALEIYMVEYVGKMDCKFESPDIREIYPSNVISFNYTNTYERFYDEGDIPTYDYIHGKINNEGTVETNNMVLGIDEYLPDDRKNKDIEFIAFKKYYQRVHKQTGCEYKNWVDEIKTDYNIFLEFREVSKRENLKKFVNGDKEVQVYQGTFKTHRLYIFGHSLDVADGDVLKDLILNDKVWTTIYYLNKEIMGQQIANLVKVIGQEELIKRTGGNNKRIEFKLQQNMVENTSVKRIYSKLL